MKCAKCDGPLWASRSYPRGLKQWHHTMKADADHEPELDRGSMRVEED